MLLLEQKYTKNQYSLKKALFKIEKEKTLQEKFLKGFISL
jgi:hypothetical protein